jgi:acetyl-CoA acetyltransferase
MSLKDQTCIVGVGHTDYYKRGGSFPRSGLELLLEAILKALADAGLDVGEVDGFSSYSGGGVDGATMGNLLGLPEVRFTAVATGGGGGSCASVGNAAAAVHAGIANVVVCAKAVQQGGGRYGQSFARTEGAYAAGSSPAAAFIAPFGLMSPGQMFSLVLRRHMHEYGTTARHLGEVAVAERFHASRNPRSIMRQPITLEDHAASRMISDPFRLLDYCLETDGAVAVVIASAERARDLKHRPVYISGAAQGGAGRWGPAVTAMQMPDALFTTAGAGTVARNVYAMAGVSPQDIDVVEFYDHFSGMVLLQLEDYGLAPRGEGGHFVENGGIRWPDGHLPVNTHGGNLSDVYLLGMTHIVEAVHQLRGVANCQVEGAELALVSGGPAPIPTSALILKRG